MSFITKFKKMSPVVKATLIFGIASFATSGINYITTPIFTRLLTTTEYGMITIYNTWYSVLQVIISLTLIYPGVLNVGLYEHSDNRWKYLSGVLGIITVNTVLFFVILLLFHKSIIRLINLPLSLVVLMLLLAMLQPAITLWTQKQRYEYRYKLAFLVSVGGAILSQIVSLICVSIYKNTGINLAVVRLWGSGIVTLSISLVLYFYLLRKGRNFYDISLWKETLIVTVPLIPHYLSHVVLNGTDKIMIERMVGMDKAGIYGLAATLSTIGVLLWRALKISFSPFVNKKLGERDFNAISRSVKVLWINSAALCVIGALLGPEVINLLGTKEYLEAINIVPPIAFGVYLHMLYDSFSAVSFFHKKSSMIMFASITAAISNVVLNYFFVKNFGYIAAAYTTMISNIILVLMHYWIVKRIEKENVYNIKETILISIITFFCCMICLYLYMVPSFIRYIIAAIICAILFSKKSVLYRTIATMKV